METLEELRHQVCDIGRRLYERQFVAANDGNISLRLDADQLLCTPTLISKGHMQPADLCVVDMQGEQLGGRRQRSSEILLHLEVYRQRPDVQSVVHCHPPHVNAFGITDQPIPSCVMPEVELFLGEVPTAPYALTGTEALAESIRPFVTRAQIVVLANHGTVSWGESLERALWWTEILNAYCRTLILSQQVGSIQYLTDEQVWELIEVKKKWGLSDPRDTPELKTVELRERPLFG